MKKQNGLHILKKVGKELGVEGHKIESWWEKASEKTRKNVTVGAALGATLALASIAEGIGTKNPVAIEAGVNILEDIPFAVAAGAGGLAARYYINKWLKSKPKEKKEKEKQQLQQYVVSME